MSTGSSPARAGSVPGGGARSSAEERPDLSCETVDGEQIRTVAGHLDLEDLVADGEEIDERRPGLGRFRENEDAGVVLAELELLLGEDHPCRALAPHRPLFDPQPSGQEAAGQDDADGRSRLEVPGTADDLTRARLADVDLTQAHAVGVRVGGDVDDSADPEVIEVRVDVRDTTVQDPLHLARRCRQPCRQIGQRDLDRDVLAQPGERDAHQNCVITRRSESQSSRTSGTPWRSWAIRSSPSPKAKPETSSGS